MSNLPHLTLISWWVYLDIICLHFVPSIAYSHRNLFGRNQKVNFSMEKGQIDSIIRMNYTDPWIEGDDKRTSRSIMVQVFEEFLLSVCSICALMHLCETSFLLWSRLRRLLGHLCMVMVSLIMLMWQLDEPQLALSSVDLWDLNGVEQLGFYFRYFS